MPVYVEKDFDKMAEDVVHRFMDEGSPLAEGAACCAKKADLNPDQIERLAQTTNNLAFLRLMDQQKSAGARDLTQEFEPVHAATVIRIIISKAAPGASANDVSKDMSKDAPKDSGTETDELPDEMKATRAPVSEKAAAAPIEMPIDEVGDRRRALTAAFNESGRLRKLAEHLHIERLAVEQDFDAKIDTLCDRMRRIDAPVLDDFEKDAMSVRGDALGLGVVNLVRASFGVPPREPIAAEKIAYLHDHHLATPSEELRLFEELVADAERSQRLEEGSTWIRQRLH